MLPVVEAGASAMTPCVDVVDWLPCTWQNPAAHMLSVDSRMHRLSLQHAASEAQYTPTATHGVVVVMDVVVPCS